MDGHSGRCNLSPRASSPCPALSVEIEAMGAIGYDSFLMPASPGQGSRNSSQGGVGILVKTHLGARLRAQFSREGCGYVAVTIRTQGADLTLVSLLFAVFYRMCGSC